MLRVAVCDDEKIIANQMEKCVLDICRRENIPVGAVRAGRRRSWVPEPR